MDELTYEDLLRLQLGELPERTPFCPDDQVLAEYFDGALEESERLATDRHLAECSFCLARVGSLERLERDQSRRRIPSELLASAKALEHAEPRRRIIQQAPAWAAAAIVIMAFFLIIGIERSPFEASRGGPETDSPTIGQQSQLRNAKPLSRTIELIAPAAGGNFRPGAVIRWTEVPENVHYQVFVLSKAGDVLWTERLQRPEWPVLEPVQPQSGSEYFFRVQALLRDGRTISSTHLPFKVSSGE